MKKISITAVFLATLAGCSTINSNIESSNFTYLTSDVSVKPFGSNYQISSLIQVGDQRLMAKTYAAACENGYGDLVIEGNSYGDTKVFKAATAGNKGQDEIFKRLCLKGMSAAYAMENKLSDSDKQRRDAAVQKALARPAAAKRRPAVEAVEQNNDPVNVTCITNRYDGGSYTNCKEK